MPEAYIKRERRAHLERPNEWLHLLIPWAVAHRIEHKRLFLQARVDVQQDRTRRCLQVHYKTAHQLRVCNVCTVYRTSTWSLSYVASKKKESLKNAELLISCWMNNAVDLNSGAGRKFRRQTPSVRQVLYWYWFKIFYIVLWKSTSFIVTLQGYFTICPANKITASLSFKVYSQMLQSALV